MSYNELGQGLMFDIFGAYKNYEVPVDEENIFKFDVPRNKLASIE